MTDDYQDYGDDVDVEFQEDEVGDFEEVWTAHPEDNDIEKNDDKRRGADDDDDPDNPFGGTAEAKNDSDAEEEEDVLDEMDEYTNVTEAQPYARNRPKVYTENVVVIKGDARRTLPIVTEFEKVRLISVRSEMLDGIYKFTGKKNKTTRWAAPLIDIGQETDSLKIAEMEFFAKKIPIKIRRPIGNNRYEEWDPNQMRYLVR